MKDFPTELVLEVLQYVSISDRLTFRTTCRSFCSLASPLAFRAVHVTNSVKSMSRLENLERSEELRTLVQELVFCYTPNIENRGPHIVDGPRGWSEDHDGMWYFQLEKTRNSMETALKNLVLFPFLHTLRLDFASRHTFLLGAQDDEDDILDAIYQGALMEPSRLNLNLVELTKSVTYDFSEFHTGYLTSIATVASLNSLSLVFRGDLDATFYIDQNSYGDVVQRTFLRPAQNNLSSLALHSDQYMNDLLGLGCHFVRLTSLSLNRITFCYFIKHTPVLPPNQVEIFIIRHKATLERLELRDCPIVLPPFGHDDSRTASCVWSRVWNRFETELSRLRDFALTRRLILEGMGTVDYVTLSERSRLHEAAVMEQSADDEEALERFRSTVHTRKAGILIAT